ncbi:DinB family protein [Micromonospora yasonensis]|nr:DinB family protein [Micromonospora yasonensis]MCW3845387.1 DinB family protein [Micromonospora yasonensis]
MTDLDAKANLHRYLREAREALLGKLDGLSEYVVRRAEEPVT